MTDAANQALKKQCSDQFQRCQYTSASLFIWLRAMRSLRIIFLVVPILFGAIAGWDLLKSKPDYAAISSFLALLAGSIPAVYAALKLDEHLPVATRLAGEYKNLEIIFADLRELGTFKEFDEFESEYIGARKRLEKANAEAYTAPQWCFRRAQKYINAGNYSFDLTAPTSGTG